MAKRRKRYVQVGLGGRSAMYTDALVGPYADRCDLVAVCDTNLCRLDVANGRIAKSHPAVSVYPASAFDRMIREARPDVVIVTTMDSTHAKYICRAMELGCDVVTEKPMTTDAVMCRRILRTASRTGRKLQVTFNYRYSPPRSQVREIIASGKIGTVLGVHFEWMLDTRHGADYFRRWHRRRENSGSLLVHKATHHFDLVNWWLGDDPEQVFAHASRKYYTPETAARLGLKRRGERCHACRVSAKCPFFLDMAKYPDMKSLYLDCELCDGYFRDRCVFSPEIDIWDNMSVAVRYSRGATLSYSLNAFAPYEGYRIAFNGTLGRLEHLACENTYVSGDGSAPGELRPNNTTLTLIPEFSAPQPLEVRTGAGGHGGGDNLLLDDIFNPKPAPDPLRRKADQRAGTYSILVGVAAARSIDTGRAVKIDSLLGSAKSLLPGGGGALKRARQWGSFIGER